ncbi:hypothetical protein M0R04_07995 [Candidatus Dojkabacteria bacterium]|jgi:hypothetical protein|nr:hypothetical protein [Candidatus Dojkabacteria bacterium]
MLTRLAEIWMALGRVNIDGELAIRILGEDGPTFSTIKAQDLKSQFDFEFESDSLKSMANLEDRQQYISLLQSTQDPDFINAIQDKIL